MSKYDFTPAELDVFFDAYRECALWASCDEEGEPLDALYSDDDLAVETHNSMLNDCKNFIDEYGVLIRRAIRSHTYDISQAGHDFWLTRNRHGAGFWDRGIGKVGKWLTDAAHSEGSVDLYVGDDGLIYS